MKNGVEYFEWDLDLGFPGATPYSQIATGGFDIEKWAYGAGHAKVFSPNRSDWYKSVIVLGGPISEYDEDLTGYEFGFVTKDGVY